MTNKKKMLSIIALLFILLFFWLFFIFNQHKAAGFSCRAAGKLYINGYTLSYLSRYQFNDGTGFITFSGKVSKAGQDLGILGRQVKVDYINHDGLYTVTNKSSRALLESNISPEDYHKMIPPFYYEEGRVQNITVTPMGKGFRLEYNAFPVGYCY